MTYTDNKVRSAYGFLQTDSWGGTQSAAATPDSLYTLIGLPDRLAGMNGSNASGIIPSYFQVDTVGLISFLERTEKICSESWTGDAIPGTCLATFTADRRINEKTIAPWIQSLHSFDLGAGEAHLRLGLRYEDTQIQSSALVPIPTGTVMNSFNEIGLSYSGQKDFTTLKGHYDHWLPAIDLDVSPLNGFKLRASYSHTITRPDYNSLQGGIQVNQPIRPGGGGTAGSGNPSLLPYLSKNIDASAEWYYGRDSYISVGYFRKSVSNFIGNETVQQPLFNLTNPGQGAIFQAARGALGPNAAFNDSRDDPQLGYIPPTTASILGYVVANNPSAVAYNGIRPIGIIGQPGDPLVQFTTSRPSNSSQTAKLSGWEFAIQHSFWDTGFGAILNYTIVNSDTRYDNTQRYTVTQFAVNGVSDSANAVVYYDKNGIQFRVAYNWRDEFLSGYGLDPFYIEAYGQFDVSASVELKKGLTVFAEGINVTNADRRGHMRNDQTVFFAAPGYARYAAGVRVTF